MSFLWYVADDGSELCDFELGCTSQWRGELEEIRHTLSFMVHERACLVSKLRGMYTLREYLTADHYQKADMKCKCDQATVGQEACGACVYNVQCTMYNVDVSGNERRRDISTVEAENNTTHATERNKIIGVSGPDLESIELVTQLRQENQELQQHIIVLQEVVYLSQVDGCSQTGGCNSCRILKAELVRYITRVRKLEHAAKARQVLCSSLIENLDVMTRKANCNLRAVTSTTTGMSGEKKDDATRRVESAQQPEASLQRLNGGSPEKYSKEKPNEQQRSDSTDSAHSGRSVVSSEGRSVPTSSSSVVVKHELRRGPPGLCEEPVLKKRLKDAEQELKEVKEKLNKSSDQKSKLEEEIEEMKSQHFKEVTMLRIQINKLDQVNKQYQDMIAQLQGQEHSIKRDMDQMLLQARDMVDRERQEKFASMAEQKSLRQQVENLSTTMKSLQVKNEDMARFQCDQDEAVDDYRRLKKLIQENGLPTVDQLIALRRQNETYREDSLNERKEKERLSSLKDKLKRDLDNTQSRISSLQEQVYKYREHIYFLQQKSKQDTGGPPSSPLFEQMIPSVVPSSPLAVASKLYGSSAPQYINETLLQGQGQGQGHPPMPFDGKKASAGKHGEGSMGKPWQQFQQPQGNAGRFGRQISTEDWKRGYPPGHSGAHPLSWDVFSPPQSRLSSASNLSSPRSGSSSSEDVSEGTGQDRGHFGGGPRERGQFGAGQPERQQYLRRQGPRPTLTERVSDPEGRQMQQYGPPSSPFEAWSKPNFPQSRVHRHYSSPCGNGLRSPTPDHWSSGQNVSGFQRPWQAFPEHSAFQETTISTSSGLRPTADPWPPVTSNGQSNSTSVSSGEETPSMRMAGVSSIR